MNETGPLILIVEDNREVLRLNSRALKRAGYRVRCAETLAGTITELEMSPPDIIILDILLPDGNGLDFLPSLRDICDSPVLFLTSLKEHGDMLRGIAAGGDDYMVKPYRLNELLVRVNALWRRERRYREKLRQRAASPAPIIERGPLRLDTLAFRAYFHGEDVGLKPKEFALLLLLVTNEGKPLSGQSLYEAVWRLESNGDTRTIWAHISKLRAKLDMDASGNSLSITFVRGSGYCFQVGDGDV